MDRQLPPSHERLSRFLLQFHFQIHNPYKGGRKIDHKDLKDLKKDQLQSNLRKCGLELTNFTIQFALFWAAVCSATSKMESIRSRKSLLWKEKNKVSFQGNLAFSTAHRKLIVNQSQLLGKEKNTNDEGRSYIKKQIEAKKEKTDIKPKIIK